MDNKSLPIYLDYMATSPVDPRVIIKMQEYLGPTTIFGNPSSTTHAYGQMAMHAIDEARSKFAEIIGAYSDEIVFTSGATEANNLAILGAARFYQHKGRHLITLTTEHQSVLDCFFELEREGFKVSYLNPQKDGILDLEKLNQALTKDTILVSIMHVNNEIGVIQDINAIGNLLADKGIIFHVDAAQSIGKLPINVKQYKVNLMSFSAHKNYGPKGVGALYIQHKPRVRLAVQSFGGRQEGGLRSGTLPTHQIIGMTYAIELAENVRQEEQANILALRQKLWNGINHLPGIQLNGHTEKRIAGNLNISFANVSKEDSLLIALSNLATSKSSACTSALLQPSHVLLALGLEKSLAYNSIRISLGRFTTETEIERTIEIICSSKF